MLTVGHLGTNMTEIERLAKKRKGDVKLTINNKVQFKLTNC